MLPMQALPHEEEQDRARAEAGDTAGRRVQLMLGGLSAQYEKVYSVFLCKVRSNPELAPGPAEGGDTWEAVAAFALLSQRANDTVTGAAAADLNDIYGGSYARARFSPAATLARETHVSALQAATAGRDVLLNCHHSVVANALHRLVTTGGLTHRQHIGIVEFDGLLYPDVRHISTAPDYASSAPSWWGTHVTPLVSVVLRHALTQRPYPLMRSSLSSSATPSSEHLWGRG